MVIFDEKIIFVSESTFKNGSSIGTMFRENFENLKIGHFRHTLWYVRSFGDLNALFEGSDFSAPLHRLIAPKKWFFCRFFPFFGFLSLFRAQLSPN